MFGYFDASSSAVTAASAYPIAPRMALTALSSSSVLDFSQRMTGESGIRSRVVQLCDDCGVSVGVRRILASNVARVPESVVLLTTSMGRSAPPSCRQFAYWPVQMPTSCAAVSEETPVARFTTTAKITMATGCPTRPGYSAALTAPSEITRRVALTPAELPLSSRSAAAPRLPMVLPPGLTCAMEDGQSCRSRCATAVTDGANAVDPATVIVPGTQRIAEAAVVEKGRTMTVTRIAATRDSSAKPVQPNV
jgi:hypothetical protein